MVPEVSLRAPLRPAQASRLPQGLSSVNRWTALQQKSLTDEYNQIIICILVNSNLPQAGGSWRPNAHHTHGPTPTSGHKHHLHGAS